MRHPEVGILRSVAPLILLVEDDARIRSALAMALEDEGYEVRGVETGEEGLSSFRAQRPDLVLLDVLLPGMSGLDTCRAIRHDSDVPIVMVTARTDSHDIVAGLEAGADDYVTKPFVVKELVARMRALLRRVHAGGDQSDHLVFGDLEVLPPAGLVRLGGTEVTLTKTEFHLLCELAQNAGIVLSREQLLERVWGYDYLGDGRLVDAHIRRLRTKVERDPSEPELILTVRGLGYRMRRP
jgi:DNA-binding response OmpR family regulator